jgi:hypothetical protein
MFILYMSLLDTLPILVLYMSLLDTDSYVFVCFFYDVVVDVDVSITTL